MYQKKEVSEVSSIGFVKWFSELNKSSGSVAGGKGANLAEIYNLKVPVPPGFVVTAQAYDYFIKKSNIVQKISSLLSEIDYENTAQLDDVTKQVRALIEKAEFPLELKEEIIESYEALSLDSHGGSSADELIGHHDDGVFVAVRSSATTEDLAEASFAGQQDTFLNVKGNDSLLLHIKRCFASLFTPRATYYRNKKGFVHEKSSLAVVVQKMINSEKSGVIFSKDPSTKRDDVIIEAVWGLGEGIVSGQITPDRYIVSKKNSGNLEIIEKSIGNKKIAIVRGKNDGKETINLDEEKSNQQVLKNHEVIDLAEIALRLEEHYKKAQDIEFAISGEKIYVVQTRPITTLERRAEVDAGQDLKGEVILTGLAASPGIGFGKIKIVESMDDLQKVKTGDVLVTKMTNPDMVVTMQRSAAIVTDEGGLTAHAAIVSREMGIPAVVGTQDATTKLKDGEIITVNGFTGKIYKGKVSEVVQKEIKPVTAKTRTEIKVMLDLPSFAQRASKTAVKGIGLARIEGIIAESGKHPKYFLEKNRIKDYEEIIFKGIKEMSKYFEEIWVRTSDIRSDEFQNLEGAPKEVEANPMLGMHGIRFSLKNPEIMLAELRAMKRVSEQGKKIGVMAPQIISVEEVRGLKSLLEKAGFKDAKLGVMIETPAAVELISELCDEGIEFASFGTNDLTQYTLAVDRGNELVQALYDDMHPAVLRQLAHVIKVCKERGVESSICGQAGSKREMAKFLVETGIDSISVNADAAAEIAEYVAEIEATRHTKAPKSEFAIKTEKGATKEQQEKVSQEIRKTISIEAQILKPEDFPLINGAEFVPKAQKETVETEEDEILNIF